MERDQRCVKFLSAPRWSTTVGGVDPVEPKLVQPVGIAGWVPPDTAVQLFSVRRQLADDLDATLDRLVQLGFRAVEPALDISTPPELQAMIRTAVPDWRPFDVPAAVLRKRLDAHGLAVTSTHAHLPPPDSLEAVLTEQATLGSPVMVVPLLFGRIPNKVERLTDTDGIRWAVEQFDRAADVATTFGMTLGYHNHPPDVQANIAGRTGLETFFDLVDPRVIAEVDAYWVKVGGRDPAALVTALDARVTHLHLKDGDGGTLDPSLPLGAGGLDVAAVLAAARHARWHIIELDNVSEDNAWSVLQASLDHLTRVREAAN